MSHLDRFVCTICQELARTPLQSTCHHVFCESCWKKWTATGRTITCPNCKHPSPSPKPLQEKDPLAYQFLSIQTINCLEHADKGCDWKGEYRDAKHHATHVCPFTSLPCMFCHESFPRKDVKEHMEKTCPQTLVTCPRCQDQRLRYHMIYHDLHCPEVTVKCLDCPMEYLRKDELKHQCPTPREKCPYHDYGCNERHVKDDLDLVPSLKRHLDMVVEDSKKKRIIHASNASWINTFFDRPMEKNMYLDFYYANSYGCGWHAAKIIDINGDKIKVYDKDVDEDGKYDELNEDVTYGRRDLVAPYGTYSSSPPYGPSPILVAKAGKGWEEIKEMQRELHTSDD